MLFRSPSCTAVGQPRDQWVGSSRPPVAAGSREPSVQRLPELRLPSCVTPPGATRSLIRRPDQLRNCSASRNARRTTTNACCACSCCCAFRAPTWYASPAHRRRPPSSTIICISCLASLPLTLQRGARRLQSMMHRPTKLTANILGRTALVERIKAEIPDVSSAHKTYFNLTPLE